MPLISEAPAGSGDWDAEAATTSIDVFADFAPALGEAFGAARDRDTFVLLWLGFGVGAVTLTGLLYEFYRGDHAH